MEEKLYPWQKAILDFLEKSKDKKLILISTPQSHQKSYFWKSYQEHLKQQKDSTNGN